MLWIELKIWIVDFVGLERDALHVYFGVLLQLTVALFCRRGIASLWPIFVVLGLESFNEYMDLTSTIHDGGIEEASWHESRKDLLNTMALPLILMFSASLFPRLNPFGRRTKSAETSQPIDGRALVEDPR